MSSIGNQAGKTASPIADLFRRDARAWKGWKLSGDRVDIRLTNLVRDLVL